MKHGNVFLIIPFFIIILISDIFAKEYRIELINEKSSKGMNIRHLRLVDIFPQKLNNANQVILLKKNNGNLFITYNEGAEWYPYKLAAGIDKDERITIYPNPASQILNAEINSTDLKNLRFEIVDLLGNVVLISDNLTSGTNSIDISTLLNGAYTIKLITEDEIITLKFIKE